MLTANCLLVIGNCAKRKQCNKIAKWATKGVGGAAVPAFTVAL